MKISRFILLVTFGAAALSGRSEIQLKGLTVANGEPLFSLYSTEDQTSKWVSLGQSFAGFKAESFDARTEALVIVKEDSRQTLRLAKSGIKTMSPEEALAQLRSLSGMELAVELARRGDADISEKLRLYQSVTTRLGELRQAVSQNGDAEKSGVAIRFLESQSEELKAQLLESAAKKAALPLKVSAKP